MGSAQGAHLTQGGFPMRAFAADSSRQSKPATFRLLAGVALIVPASAYGQTAPQPPVNTPASDQSVGEALQTTKTQEGEIVVLARHYVPEGAETATKTNIPLIQTPQSISVITRDQIDLLNFIDAQQAVRYTSGAFGENYGPDPR